MVFDEYDDDQDEPKSPGETPLAAPVPVSGSAGGAEALPAQRQPEVMTATAAEPVAPQAEGEEESGSEAEEGEAEAQAPAKKTRRAAKKKEPEPQLKELDPERAALPWYVVHTYSGFEQRARSSLEERVRLHGLERQFGNIMVPQETVVELVRGQKRTSTRKFFPGYILVQMDLNDTTWHLVKETPKVTGFVGDARNPSPLTAAEVDSLTKQMESGVVKPRPKVQFEEGDAIKVIDGPFADFNGTVDEVKPDKGKLRVLISIFGRNTPVELDFVQVEKI
jgi:transcriptional antiterminator NusG